MQKVMLRRVLALVLGLVLTGFVSAQAGGNRTADFIKIFENGTYHMKAKMLGGGIEATIETFVKGGMVAATTTAGGMPGRVILKDNKTYIIMDSARMVMVMPLMEAAELGGVDVNGLTFTGSGTARFDGRNLPYEEYTGLGNVKMQVFLDGNTLAGIRSFVSGTTADMVITELNPGRK